MCVYLRTKCHVSSTILMGFGQGGKITPTAKRTPKKSTKDTFTFSHFEIMKFCPV